MRLIYIEVSPQVVAALNGKMHFNLDYPEPVMVQLLESPNAVYSRTTNGPVSLHLLVLATEKYIKIMEEAVARHELIRPPEHICDKSSMENVYNTLKARLQNAKERLEIFREAVCVATSATAACN